MHFQLTRGPKIRVVTWLVGCLLLCSGGVIITSRDAVRSAPRYDDGLPGQWMPSNPGGGGAFAAIGAGPTGIVLAASDLSGVYRSRDRGRTWDNIGAFDGLTSTHAGSVGFDPQDGNILYVGTEEGIFRSRNGGDTVEQVLSTGYISDIKFAPSNPQIGYAGYHAEWNSDRGVVYKSVDRGLSWQQSSQNLPAGIRILKLVVHPTNPNTLYLLSGRARFAAGSKTVWRSVDGGVNWTPMGANLGAIMDIALDTNSPNLLYASSYEPYMEGESEVYTTGAFHRSLDSGNTWSKMADRTGAIWLDRDDQRAIRLIHVNHQWPWDPESNGVWESTNQGATWSKVSQVEEWGMGWVEAYWLYHESFDGPVKSLGEDLADPDTLWWTNTQWVMATFNDGRRFAHQHTDAVTPGHWQSRGFDNVVALDMAISPVDGRLYVGYYDIGCWYSDDSAATWQLCNYPDYSWSEGKGGNMMTVVADPTRAGVVWSAQSRNIGEPTALLRSNNGGQSWTLSNGGLTNATLISGLAVDATSPANNRTLFVTVSGNVYASSDDGRTWAKRFDCNGCRQTAVDSFNGKLVYAGGESGLWRSTNGGAAGSWQKIGPTALAGALGDAFYTSDWAGVTAIVPDPVNPNWVYVTAFGAGKGLYRSKDGGATWEKLWTNDFARNVAMTPAASAQLLYVTSSSSVNRGVYQPGSLGILVSSDGGASWQPVNDGLEWPFAGNVVLDPQNSNLLYIDSAGPGVYKRSFGNTPPPTPTATPQPGNGNLLTNGDFSQGDTGWTIWGEGVTYHTQDELCLYFGQPTANLWDLGVDQKGFALAQGKRYRLRMQLWSQSAATIKPIIGESQPPWVNYWNQHIDLPADQVQSYSYDFTMNESSDANAGLSIHVGGHSSKVLCIDQVELTALGTNAPPTATPTPTRTPVGAPTTRPTATPTTRAPTPTPTFAAGHGGLRGTVVGESALPLAGIRVSVWRSVNGRWREASKGVTDNSGAYQFNNLTPGNYRVRFADPQRRYQTQYYQQVTKLSRATDLPVLAGSAINGVDATLTRATARMADISGTVAQAIDPATGQTQINAWAGSAFTIAYAVSCGDTGAAISEATLLVGEESFAMQPGRGGETRYQVTLHVPEDLAVGLYQSLAISWRCTIEGVTAAARHSALIGAIQTNDAAPGGYVGAQDTGAPIANATVTLYQLPDWHLRTAPADADPASCESLASRPAGQSWRQPAPVELGEWVLAEAVEGNPATITPASNPQTTGDNGGFGWQVVEGCYYVEVAAAGYAPVVGPVIGVQNALTDLTILLTAQSALFLPIVIR